MAETKDALSVSSNSAEGENQKPSQDSVESKATRRARAAAANPGTVAADHRIVIEDAPCLDVSIEDPKAAPSPRTAVVAEDEFAHLPLTVRRASMRQRVRVWRDGQGNWWRKPGYARIQRWPAPDGDRRFVVTLFHGANETDLGFLLNSVKGARSGVGIDTVWTRITAEGADELTYQNTYSRPYGDPYTHSDSSDRVKICRDEQCVEQWHAGGTSHVVDSVTREIEDGRYSIFVEREPDPESRWRVNVYVDDFYGTPDEVAAFVSDLQWMQAECQRANERTAS